MGLDVTGFLLEDVDVVVVATVTVFVSLPLQWKATLSSPVAQAHMLLLLLLFGGSGAHTPVARAFVCCLRMLGIAAGE